jgi:hypothetical protein
VDIERIRLVDALRWLCKRKTDEPPDLGGQTGAPRPTVAEKLISSAAATILALRANLRYDRPNDNPTAEASTTNQNTTGPDPVKLQPQETSANSTAA